MAWQTYIEPKSKVEPLISVYYTGVVNVNAKAVRDFELTRFKYASIMINQEEKKFALLLSTKKEYTDSRKLTSGYSNLCFWIGKKFIKIFGIGKYRCTWNEEKKWLEANGEEA